MDAPATPTLRVNTTDFGTQDEMDAIVVVQALAAGFELVFQLGKPGRMSEIGAGEQVDFTLETLSVSTGTTLTWTNRDGPSHTTTSGVPGSPGGEWNSEVLRSGSSFSFTFTEPGEFQYFCGIHSFMMATVTVS